MVWDKNTDITERKRIERVRQTQPAWEQLVHPDDRPKAVRLVEHSFQTGEPVEGEWRVVWHISKAINSINQIIHSTLDFDEIMQKTVSEAAKVIGSDTAAIYLRKTNVGSPAMCMVSQRL